MGGSRQRIRLVFVLGAALLGGTGTSGAGKIGLDRIDQAFRRGADCLAKDFDGSAFRDPYLSYVYPDENLPVPPGRPRLTYRTVDAYVDLVLISRAAPTSEPLSRLVERADGSLREVVPVWGDRGIYNLRKGARPGGVALDTFCFVGWLYGDPTMAGIVASAIDDDGWLPEGLYGGAERFRRDADESWCLRLLASKAGPGLDAGAAVLNRIAKTLREAVTSAPPERGTFYVAYHLAMVLAEASSRGGLDPDRAALEREITSVLVSWAASRPESTVKPGDVPEWINLASLEMGAGQDVDRLRERAIEVVLSGQSEDGCFGVPGTAPSRKGSSFFTLRALLALARERARETSPAVR